MKIKDPILNGNGWWTVDVYDDPKAMPVAKFFGTTADEASNRAKKYMKPNEDDSALYGNPPQVKQ